MARAAEQLHVTQPALSRNLQRLEAECGTPLFDRVKKRLMLNEAGRISLGYAIQIINSARDMKAALYRYYTQSPTLRISTCAPTPMMYLLTELGIAFPAMTTQITWRRDRNLEDELLSGSADLVISAVPPTTPGVDSLPFMEETLMIAFHKSHPLAGKSTVTPQELEGETILQNANSGFWNELCQSKLKTASIQEFEEFIVFLEMAQHSKQTCFATDAWARLHPEIYKENRVLVPFPDPDCTAVFYLCFLSEQRKRWQLLLKTLKPLQY